MLNSSQLAGGIIVWTDWTVVPQLEIVVISFYVQGTEGVGGVGGGGGGVGVQ